MKIIDTVVFADGPNGGNPCPVVMDADQLSREEMMQIAKERKVEVGFILKSQKPDCDYQFKFFVPNREMEMCVHATIACVTVLKTFDLINKNQLTIETLAGHISLLIDEDLTVHVNQGKVKEKTVEIDIQRIVDVLNIQLDDLCDTPIVNISTSRFKTLIQLKDVEVLNGMKPDFEALWELCDDINSTGFYPFVKDKDQYVARQFPNNTGYEEDPATGVAASALGAYIKKYIDPYFERVSIHQGDAMGQPSRITVENTDRSNRIIGKAELL